jgi:hypothetical protein
MMRLSWAVVAPISSTGSAWVMRVGMAEFMRSSGFGSLLSVPASWRRMQVGSSHSRDRTP